MALSHMQYPGFRIMTTSGNIENEDKASGNYFLSSVVLTFIGVSERMGIRLEGVKTRNTFAPNSKRLVKLGQVMFHLVLANGFLRRQTDQSPDSSQHHLGSGLRIERLLEVSRPSP